jgi:hypothetical protein
MGRLALPAVAAVWLVVAVAALRSRRRVQRRTSRQWHAALDTVSRWPVASAQLPPGVTWCRTLASPAGVPRQRIGSPGDDEQRLAERRVDDRLQSSQRRDEEAVEHRQQQAVAGSAV